MMTMLRSSGRGRLRAYPVRPLWLVVLVALLLPVTAGPASAATSRDRPRTLYYLALGDSLSVGVQPDADGRNQPTDEGYSDDLLAVGRLVLPRLRLVKLGCHSEETIDSMISGGRCSYPTGAQLPEAVAFLRAHRHSTVLVTLDIGANNLSRCADRQTGEIDMACVALAFRTVAGTLPTILTQLRAAAGPHVPILGMNYYNPFLAYWLRGAAGQQLARVSAQIMTRYNDALEAVYRSAGVPVADVERAFASTDFDHVVEVPGLGPLPRNVARICQWSWMCAPPPRGPNVHGRPAGYWVMAATFLVALIRVPAAEAAGRRDHGERGVSTALSTVQWPRPHG